MPITGKTYNILSGVTFNYRKQEGNLGKVSKKQRGAWEGILALTCLAGSNA